MSKIFFMGDNHSHFEHIIRAVEEHRPDAIILLGDMEPARPLEVELAPILDKTEIRFIHGNHDADSQEVCQHVFGSKLFPLNLHGRVDTVAGVRVAGLGGIFRGKMWRPPEEPNVLSFGALLKDVDRQFRSGRISESYANDLKRIHMATIFPDQYHKLAKLEADVLVTHEAPSCHPMGFAALDHLARSMKVKHAFHGHHHDRLDYSPQWSALRFHAHGVGFCGVTDLDGNVIQPGDFDDDRRRRGRGTSH